jgi:hypothetical protein
VQSETVASAAIAVVNHAESHPSQSSLQEAAIPLEVSDVLPSNSLKTSAFKGKRKPPSRRFRSNNAGNSNDLTAELSVINAFSIECQLSDQHEHSDSLFQHENSNVLDRDRKLSDTENTHKVFELLDSLHEFPLPQSKTRQSLDLLTEDVRSEDCKVTESAAFPSDDINRLNRKSVQDAAGQPSESSLQRQNISPHSDISGVILEADEVTLLVPTQVSSTGATSANIPVEIKSAPRKIPDYAHPELYALSSLFSLFNCYLTF